MKGEGVLDSDYIIFFTIFLLPFQTLLVSSEEREFCCSAGITIPDAIAAPAAADCYSGINETAKYTAAVLLRPEDNGQRPKNEKVGFYFQS